MAGHAFRQVDVTRAWKGAKAAGIENPRVEIDPRTGRIFIVELPGPPSEATPTANEWDEVLPQ